MGPLGKNHTDPSRAEMLRFKRLSRSDKIHYFLGKEQSELLKRPTWCYSACLVHWNSSPGPSKSTERGLERDLDSTVSKQMATKLLLNRLKTEDDAK